MAFYYSSCSKLVNEIGWCEESKRQCLQLFLRGPTGDVRPALKLQSLTDDKLFFHSNLAKKLVELMDHCDDAVNRVCSEQAAQLIELGYEIDDSISVEKLLLDLVHYVQDIIINERTNRKLNYGVLMVRTCMCRYAQSQAKAKHSNSSLTFILLQLKGIIQATRFTKPYPHEVLQSSPVLLQSLGPRWQPS